MIEKKNLSIPLVSPAKQKRIGTDTSSVRIEHNGKKL